MTATTQAMLGSLLPQAMANRHPCQQEPHLPPGSLIALSSVYSCHSCPCFLIQLLHTLQLHEIFRVMRTQHM